MHLFNRDISWLGFNFRVLQEAQKKHIPLYERIQFLSIYSSNLDEFFRVRYTVYASLNELNKQQEEDIDLTVADQIEDMINEQLPVFGSVLKDDILPELLSHNIHLYYNEAIREEHMSFIDSYFYTKVLSFLQPVMLSEDVAPIVLENNALYFLVVMSRDGEQKYGIVNIPVGNLSRFVSLPSDDALHHILFLDDVIRANLDKIFPSYKINNCYAIKMTRNADIDIEDEWSDLFEEQVFDMVRKREKGKPTRLLYEKGLDEKALTFVSEYFQLKENNLIEGGRYHNLKDLSKLPNPIGGTLRFLPLPPGDHKRLVQYSSVFDAIDHSDEMLHLPYHNYNYVLRYFNEAAIDPNVEEINLTIYRVASNSFITNALISAAKNGKQVTAFVELKARFDEENNLLWAKKMKEAGVKIIYSIPGMKVHVKVALVKRRVGLQAKYYSLLSTGNFNEGTARFYTDHILLTSHLGITQDASMLFAYLKTRKPPQEHEYIKFQHLLVAGFNFVNRLYEAIDAEIEHHKKGNQAGVTIKVNNLQEKGVIEKLYEASQAGVKIELIVRGICCLVPGVAGVSDNITVRRIVGRFLEHSRVFIFNNGGDKTVFVGSADLMNRNIHRRIEVVFPIYDPRLKKEVVDIVNLQLQDNQQATLLQPDGASIAIATIGEEKLVAQEATYNYVNENR